MNPPRFCENSLEDFLFLGTMRFGRGIFRVKKEIFSEHFLGRMPEKEKRG
jgi:hypothetical protein